MEDGVVVILTRGLPVLLLQFAVTLALLGVGVVCYNAVTPFHERELVRAGNTAAGIVAGGNFVALAIPLAATLATSLVTLGHRDLGHRRAASCSSSPLSPRHG